MECGDGWFAVPALMLLRAWACECKTKTRECGEHVIERCVGAVVERAGFVSGSNSSFERAEVSCSGAPLVVFVFPWAGSAR